MCSLPSPFNMAMIFLFHLDSLSMLESLTRGNTQGERAVSGMTVLLSIIAFLCSLHLLLMTMVALTAEEAQELLEFLLEQDFTDRPALTQLLL